MGFDAKFAAQILKEGVDIVVDKGTDAYGKIVDTKIKEKDHDTDNKIKIMEQQTSGVKDIIHTAVEALDTASDIAEKISKSVNLSRKTTAEIDEIRSRIENEKKRVDSEIENEKNRINAENSKAERVHSEKMRKLEIEHEERMKLIDEIIENIRFIRTILINIATNDPSNPTVQNYLSTLSDSMNNLTLIVSNQSKMLPFKEE